MAIFQNNSDAVATFDPGVPRDAMFLRLRQALEGFDHAQVALAVGKTERALRNWLTGRSIPSALSLRNLAIVAGCSTDWILGLPSQTIDMGKKGLRETDLKARTGAPLAQSARRSRRAAAFAAEIGTAGQE